MVTFIAHRCNSLAKLNQAVLSLKKLATGTKGCTWIEIDVTLSRGKLVLYHDMGVQALPSVKGKGRHIKRPIGLQDALAWLKTQKNVKLILDLKCMGIHQKLYTKTLLEVLKMNEDLKNSLVLTSFHHILLQNLYGALGPTWTYGAIVEAALVNLPAYLKSQLAFCTFVMVSHHIYSKDILKALGEYKVGVYMVNNPAMWPVIEKLGAEFIFRDF